MKKLIVLIWALLISVGSYSQILTPVKWSYAARKTGPDEATLYFKATIDKGWHIYSLHMAEGGPVRTTLSFSPSKLYRPEGQPREPRPGRRRAPCGPSSWAGWPAGLPLS